jgi:hypothetical protein
MITEATTLDLPMQLTLYACMLWDKAIFIEGNR